MRRDHASRNLPAERRIETRIAYAIFHERDIRTAMLTIKQNWMDELEADALGQFKRRLLRHVATLFPRRCRRLGEARVRGLIDRGVEVSERLRFTTEVDIARYVDFCVALEGDLMSPPHSAWAGSVLRAVEQPPDDRLGRVAALARRQGHSFGDRD